MSRANSPYIVGDYWLDKRRDKRADGKPQEIWQIASRSKRSVVYRSTNCRDLEQAKGVLDAHIAELKAKGRQDAASAEVIPLLITYWKEKGSQAINHDQTARSIKTFIGFLMQDEIGVRAVVTDLTPVLFERFRKWRMGPHSCSVPWGGEPWTYSTEKGVSGATVQRNVNDIRAGVNYAEDNLRIPLAPKIKDVDKRYKSKHRDRLLTFDEMARIVWYAYHNKDLFRFVVLQIATSVRPMAALQFDPAKQYLERPNLIDTQPEAAPQTKKRNAIIPAIRPMRPVLKAWAKDGASPAVSRKTAWRIMRRTLGLSEDVQPKTIRYTIATWLLEMDWIPERQISEMLGHTHQGDLARTSLIYAKYRPEQMGKVVKGLSIIWMQISRAARSYSAVHLLSTKGQGGQNVVVTKKKT